MVTHAGVGVGQRGMGGRKESIQAGYAATERGALTNSANYTAEAIK